MAVRVAKVRAFVRARLSPEGELGLYLTVGVLALAAFAWLFGGIAEDVVTGETTGLTRGMRLLSLLGGGRVVTVLSVVAGLYFVWRLARYSLTALLLTVPGGAILDVVLKQAFHRARPHWEHPLEMLTTLSFPSGHAVSAATLYGFARRRSDKERVGSG